ncbi:DUF4017 family protein [Kurthia sibirica]|uniref:DUF4017 domain-containing protein n=1 Tax=Kurthia sibirica TaxID=202750 RepID=A0A2U3ANE3_9BACL|nr:DUF4017 family protein [Kurthia sibirica]PWI26052.1 DUF4017 domain-containing protein [Kurthia sibirica]GEK34797.1 hypothetical protein KSI01_23300 [Kurthia sibirica]
MKSFKLASSVYFITFILAMTLPTSSNYSTLLWKCLIAQIYAIPAFLITLLLYIVLRSDDTIEER